MNSILLIIVVCLSLSVSGAASATSYPVHEETVEACRSVPMSVGMPVLVFHGGASESKKNLAQNSIIAVFRQGPACEMNEVGKIRVHGIADAWYDDATVAEGEVRTGDIAIRGGIGYLILQPSGKCKR